MSYARRCEYCGAYLDPSERCTCMDEEQQTTDEELKKKKVIVICNGAAKAANKS